MKLNGNANQLASISTQACRLDTVRAGRCANRARQRGTLKVNSPVDTANKPNRTNAYRAEYSPSTTGYLLLCVAKTKVTT